MSDIETYPKYFIFVRQNLRRKMKYRIVKKDGKVYNYPRNCNIYNHISSYSENELKEFLEMKEVTPAEFVLMDFN